MIVLFEGLMRAIRTGNMPGPVAALRFLKMLLWVMTVTKQLPSIARSAFRFFSEQKSTAGDALRPENSFSDRLRSSLTQAIFFTAILMIQTEAAVAVPPPSGTIITNTADLTSSAGNVSDTANVTVIIRSASSISLLQYAPTAPTAISLLVQTTEYSTSGLAGGPFANSPAPTELFGALIPVPGSKLLVPATAIKYNEPLFIRVIDSDQNLDFSVIDTIIVTLSTNISGDAVTLRLMETGPNTGEFTGYIQTNNGAVTLNDPYLTVNINDRIDVNYIDAADATDTASSNILVDPYGILFSTSDGTLIDGASVTIINVATGLPATVYGDDGISIFPSTVTSGGSVMDSGGNNYNFPAGMFRFPYVAPGTYQFYVIPPGGFDHPSTVPTATIQALPGAPYAIAVGSRGENFVVNPGPALHIDIPLDPSTSGLYVTKRATKERVSLGEFVEYKLTLSNVSAGGLTNVNLFDKLPPGFRLERGSVKLNSTAASDPAVSTDGRTLTFNIGAMASGASITIDYVTAVSAGAEMGTAVNSAYATAFGGIGSNNAHASVLVEDDMMSSRSFAMGRVMLGSCKAAPSDSGNVSLQLTGNAVTDQIHFTANAKIESVPVNNLQLLVNLPDVLNYHPGSTTFNGNHFADPVVSGKQLVFDLGNQAAGSTMSIKFQTVSQHSVYGEFSTTAHARFNIDSSTITELNRETTLATTLLENRFKDFPRSYRTRFETLSAEMTGEDRENLKSLAAILRDQSIERVTIVGHADKRKIRKSANSRYKNNEELSLARAKAVAEYIKQTFKLNDNQISTIASGASKPIYYSTRLEGRELSKEDQLSVNRRVEVFIKLSDQLADTRFIMTKPDSGQTTVTTQGPSGELSGPDLGYDAEGVKGVRLYLEDGRYVDTDENGLYHFEGLRPGTHVIQVDESSIPDDLEIYQCENNTRFAGSPNSRFVDIQAGGLWRADFYVRHKPKAAGLGEIGIQLRSNLENNNISYRVDVKGQSIASRNRQVVVKLAEGLTYVKGSSSANGNSIADPTIITRQLIFDLGSTGETNWSTTLEFKARSSIGIEGEYPTTALLRFGNSDNNRQESSRVTNTLLHQSKAVERPIFEATYDNKKQIQLSETDQRDLDSVIDYLLDKQIRQLRIISYANNQPVPAELVVNYRDNQALALDRATRIGAYLARKLSLYSNQMAIEGRILDSTDSPESAQNNSNAPERTEVLVSYADKNGEKETVANQKDSGMMKSSVSTLMSASSPSSHSEENTDGNTAKDGIQSLQNGDITNKRIQLIKLQLEKNLRPVLSVDGKIIPQDRIGFSAEHKATSRKIYSYVGVDVGNPGEHVVSLLGIDPFGNVRFNQDLYLVLTGEIAKIRVIDTTGNVADGKSPVKIRIQFIDSHDQVVSMGTELKMQGGTLKPLRPRNPLPELRTDNSVSVSRDGYIEFEPVTTSGTYTAKLVYGNMSFDIETYVKADYRDWIMVGLAEGTVGYNNVSGNMENLDSADIHDEYYNDGRLAFYAKGKIKGKYLLTTAYDSDKEKVKVSGNGLFGKIQPDKYYTLYGDNTQSGNEAASTDKLYLKLESDEFYALYGDYNTDLTVTTLSSYSRSFTGLKTEYHDSRFKVKAFAAETNQAFIKDEIPGDGTSGLYYLSNKNIVLNSEKVRIETRDRFRSEVIIESRPLTRFTDYTFDSVSGSIYFREPVYSRDRNFNPIYIVVDYEIEGNVDDKMTAGGRVAMRTSKSGPEIGATIIREGTTGAEGDLLGLDATYSLSSQSQLKVEVATTESTSGGQKREGDAYLAEISRQAGDFDSKVYFREQEPGYGLGQQNGAESGTRKYGADIRSKLRSDMTLNAEYLHQDNTNTDAKRDVIETGVEFAKSNYSINAGVLLARDEYGNGESRESNIVKGAVTRDFLDGRLKGNTAVEVGLDNESVDYPDRFTMGADYLLTESTQLFAQQEFSFGDTQDTQMTRVGIKSSPWANATLHSSVENQSSENQDRVFSNMGLTQGVEIDKHWRLDFGVERAQTISDSSSTPLNVNVPPASGSVRDDFTALSASALYKNIKWSMIGRIEARDGNLEDKLGILFGVYHEPEPGFGLSSRVQLFDTDYANGASNRQASLEFSIARRPVTSQWILLDKIRYQHDEVLSTDDVTTSKLINNLNVNYLYDRSNQLSFNHGIKYVKDELSGKTYSGITQLLGSEYRHDFNAYWDMGVQASLLHSDVGDNQKYSYGASVGHSFARNVWLSLGFNIEGFSDNDFSAAKYTAEGVYLKFRFAFDHYTSRKVMAWWEKREE